MYHFAVEKMMALQSSQNMQHQKFFLKNCKFKELTAKIWDHAYRFEL